MSDIDHATNTQVAALTSQQLREEIDTLRLLSDQLEQFMAGDPAAWTAGHALALHQSAVRIQSGVSIMRHWQESDARVAGLVHLDARRPR